MRTTLAALAALAAVTSSMAAVPAFLKSSCGSMSSNAHTADLMGVSNGEWSCVDFSAAAASQQLVKLDMANRWYGYTLQVMLWNSGRTAGAANALIWANSAAGRNVLEWIKPQNGQKDVNALPEAHNARYSNISTPITLAATTGWTGDVDGYRNNGVYALTTDVMPNPGRNTFIIKNPYDDASTTGAAAFAGAFMYRLVDASVANNVYGGLSAEVVSAHWGQLAMNSPVTVSNVLMPGSSFTVPVSASWATQGFALKGLSYTVSISPGGSSGTVASARMGWGSPAVPNGLPPPNGYGTTDDMERSFRYVSPGSQFIPGPFSQTADGQNMWYDYSAMWGPHNGTQTYSSSANSITKTWNYPVDVKDASAAGFGYIVVSIPEVQNQYDATVSPYDWSSQTSPFWDVTVTINTATEYPLLGSESNVELVNKNNMPVDGHNAASPATDPAMGPYKIYRVGTSNPLWWRMIVNMNTVTNKNLPTGVTEEGVGCMPNWDYQIVQDPNSAHGENGWGETWHNLQSSATGYNAEDFWASNADAKISKLSTAKGWLTTNLWRSGRELPGAANGALLPKINTGRGTWMMVRVSATMAAVDSGVKTCGSDHVSIGSLSASWDTVDDQCSDYTDCSPMAADNPNAGQQSDSANVNSRRFSNCVVAQKPGANYRFMPFTKCVECFSSAQCGTGQYCHTDPGTASITWGSYAGAYTVDSSSAKLVGLCRHKSPDVLGKRCRLLSQDSGSTGATATTYFPTLSSTPVDLNFGSAISNAGPAQYTTQVAAKGDATNPEFAKGAYGACGEYRYMESGMPGASTLAGPRPFVNTAAGSGWVRIALWEGFCDADQICRECVPGRPTSLTTGQVCLNGHSFNAMDVDNTVRTFAQNTNVGTALGTTGMIILLIILFAAYMYTEATRWRHTNGLPPMTCCECLCCCGCCSKLGAATATATKNPAVAA